jgi:cytochrome c
MSNLLGNKIAFSVLGTALTLMGLNELSHSFFHHAEHEKPGYFVDVPEVASGPAEAAVEEGPRDYAVLIAAGDPVAGEGVAVKCLQCHDLKPGGAAMQGPPLYGVVGRPIASVAGFKYSEGDTGLKGRAGQVWDYEHLDHFLERPKAYASGTAMNFVGLKKQKDRSDLLAYLRTLTAGEPFPLPAPLPASATAPAEGAPADPAAPAPTEGAVPTDPSAPSSGEAGTPAPAAPATTAPTTPAPATPAAPAPAPGH